MVKLSTAATGSTPKHIGYGHGFSLVEKTQQPVAVDYVERQGLALHCARFLAGAWVGSVVGLSNLPDINNLPATRGHLSTCLVL